MLRCLGAGPFDSWDLLLCFPLVPAVVARGLLEKWCVCHELVTMRFMLELSNFSLDGIAVYCIKLNWIRMDSVLF